MTIPEQARAKPDGYDAIADAAIAYGRSRVANDTTASLPTAEDVLRARQALAQCLIDVGWQPTEPMFDSIRRDAELLRQSNGGLEVVQLRGIGALQRAVR